MRCATLDVVSWFPVLQQLWIDASVRCPHAERYNESASKPGVAAVAGEAEKTKPCGTAVRSLDLETYGRLGGEGTKLLRDFCGNGGERSVQPACCRLVEDPAGASAADCTSRHILASVRIQSCAATCCCTSSSAVGRVERVQFSLEVLAVRLSCEGWSDRDRERQRLRNSVRSDTSAATIRKEVPGMACAAWTASSRVAVRSVQDAVVPQQGHVPRLQEAKGREVRRVHQRVVADGGLATAGRRILRRLLAL